MLVLQTSTIPGAGRGLFTTQDIPKGTRIGEYSGRRFGPNKILSGYRADYTFDTANNVTISPFDDCLFRFANDNVDLEQSLLHRSVIRYPHVQHNIDWFTERSERVAAKELAAILGPKKWFDKTFMQTERVWIVALSDLKAGDELFLSYGDTKAEGGYWTWRVTSKSKRAKMPPVSGEALALFLDRRIKSYWHALDEKMSAYDERDYPYLNDSPELDFGMDYENDPNFDPDNFSVE